MNKEKIGKQLAILVIAIMIVATFGGCIEGEEEAPAPTTAAPTTPKPTTPTPTERPTTFVVSKISTSDLIDGERGTAYITVKNLGKSGYADVIVWIGDTEVSSHVYVVKDMKKTIPIPFTPHLSDPEQSEEILIKSGDMSKTFTIDTKPPPTTPPPIPTMGETVTVDTKDVLGEPLKYTISVTKCEQSKQYRSMRGDNYEASPGKIFLWFYIVTQNLTDKKDSISIYENLEYKDKLYDRKFFYYGSNEGTYQVTDDFYYNGSIGPKATREGWVVFEVPEDIDLTKAKFNIYDVPIISSKTPEDAHKWLMGEWKISANPIVRPTPPPKEWLEVETFQGYDDTTTMWFTIMGDEWRVKFRYSSSSSKYSFFSVFVYPRGETAMYVSHFSCDKSRCEDTTYIYSGGGEYYFKVIAMGSWKLTVEDYL